MCISLSLSLAMYIYIYIYIYVAGGKPTPFGELRGSWHEKLTLYIYIYIYGICIRRIA